MQDPPELSQIDAAILKLQTGERVASIRYGDHTVRYAPVDLKEHRGAAGNRSLYGA